jgi:hypothetical protein
MVRKLFAISGLACAGFLLLLVARLEWTKTFIEIGRDVADLGGDITDAVKDEMRSETAKECDRLIASARRALKSNASAAGFDPLIEVCRDAVDQDPDDPHSILQFGARI